MYLIVPQEIGDPFSLLTFGGRKLITSKTDSTDFPVLLTFSPFDRIKIN